MKNIPNLFTLLNLFFGCVAIVCIIQNGITISYTDEGAQYIDLPEKIWMASLFIGLAALVDFLDGFLARLLKADSLMGRELDSLADVVSFGVAPGLIVYQFLRMSYVSDVDGIDISIGWLLPAFLIPCAAAWRLAKFNLDEEQKYGFKGVPTPAVGLLIASIPLIYWFNNNETIVKLLLNKWFWYAVIVVLCYLMTSNLPLMSLKFTDFSFRNNLSKFLLIIVSLLLIIFLKWLAVPFIFVSYIILSLFTTNTKPNTK